MKTIQVTTAATVDSRWNWLYQVGAVAALISGGLLLMAMLSLIIAGLQPDAMNGWFSPLQNNWLVILFKLNAGFSGIQFDLLHGLNPLDLAIMAFVATMYPGLYAALRRTSRIGSLLAAIQPFLGIVLFTVTQTVGRSAVMGAGLVISLVMLRSNIFRKGIVLVGILANLLLLVGDFGTTADSLSSLTAMLIGIGYVLLLTWFFLLARRLFQFRHGVSMEEPNRNDQSSDRQPGAPQVA